MGISRDTTYSIDTHTPDSSAGQETTQLNTWLDLGVLDTVTLDWSAENDMFSMLGPLLTSVYHSDYIDTTLW